MMMVSLKTMSMIAIKVKKSNPHITPTDPAYFDPDVAFEASNPS